MSKKVLVVGATGKVGRETTAQLVARGVAVRAATRNPQAYKGPRGAEAVELDFDRPATFDAAVRGVDGLFLMTRPGEPEPEKSLVPLFDKAKAAGAKRVVLLTALGVDQAEGLGLRKVEKHVLASGLPATILRPNWFMQNFSHGFIRDAIRAMGGIYVPAGNAKVSFIDARDIGAVGAAALVDDQHAGKEYALTGPRALDHSEAAAILSKSAGRTIPYVAIGEDEARKGLAQAGFPPAGVEFMVGLFQAVRAGYNSVVTSDVKRALGREPVSFEQFADQNAAAWR
jgi:uncharacterized protein YbjT (DUF2867 family)